MRMRCRHLVCQVLYQVALQVALALLLWDAVVLAQEVPLSRRSAILLSWDGTLREHLRASLARKELPNLASLIHQGSMVDIEVTGHQTDTKAGHAQMLTGYDPKITGVFSNVQFKPIPRGLSIFERLHQAFGKSGITTIMLTGKDHNLGSQGPTLLGDGEPYFLVRAGITEWDGDQGRSTSAVGQKAVGYIDRYAGKGRFFLFIHFPDVDYSGHRYGENSAAYNQAIVECDRWLGRIMAELASKGIADSTRLYVTADHGFDVGTTHHSAAPHIFLATNDTHVLHGGEQRDITPTILSMMGVDLAKVEPALPGKPLTK